MPAPGAQAQVAADGGDQRPLFPAGTLDELTLGYSRVEEQAMSWQ